MLKAMARSSGARRRKRSSRRTRKRFKLSGWLPRASTRKRWFTRFRRAPLIAQLVIGLVVVATSAVLINVAYQIVRKPTELFFPVSGTLYKTPRETWAEYESIFRRHSTDIISPTFLAALAQVEGSGNPVVRTYWRWRVSPDPFEVYRPASSAVGMYQITDGTFEASRRYCIHDHKVVSDGPWNDWDSCWFNALYFRVIPSHAVELTSAWLDVQVRRVLRRHGIRSASVRQQQDLAAIIHLCGAGAGSQHARRGLAIVPGQRCGDHDVRGYVTKVRRMQDVFNRLAAAH
jgi:hypothetical protein